MTKELEALGHTDRRPGIAVCAYEPDSSGWDLVEDLSGELWSPPGARTVRITPAEPDRLASVLGEHLRSGDCRAVLLVGSGGRDGCFRMQMRAENRKLGGKERLLRTGPGVARATAPASDIVRALRDAGLSAEASSDAEDDVGSYLLYRVLADLADGPHTPAVGLLRAPPGADESAVKKAVKGAVSVIAGQMALLPRG